MKTSVFLIIASLPVLWLSCTGSHTHLQDPEPVDTAAVQRIFFEPEELDLGMVPSGIGIIDTCYMLTNLSGQPIVVHQVLTDCGCTRPHWSGKPVAAGESATIRIAYDTRKMQNGHFSKTLAVYTSARKEPFRLKLKGEVCLSSLKSEIR